MKEGNVIESVIQLVKADYIVSTIPSFGNAIAFSRTKDYNIQKIDVFSIYKPQQRRKAKILCTNLNDKTIVSLIDTEPAISSSSLFESGVQTMDEVQPGMRTVGKIINIVGQQMNISLGQQIRGRVHITNVWDVDDLGTGHPFDSYSVGQTINCYVLSIFTVETDNSLAVTHSDPHADSTKRFVELSLKPSLLNQADQPAPQPFSLETLQTGQIIAGIIHQFTSDALWVIVAPGIRGRVPIWEISSDIDDMIQFKARYQVGRGLRLAVVSVDAEQRLFSLSARACENVAPGTTEIEEIPDYIVPGKIIPGRVGKVLPDLSISVRLGLNKYGRVFATDVDDVYRSKPFEGLSQKKFVNCYILSVSENGIDVSLRESRLGAVKYAQNSRVPANDLETHDENDIEITNIEQLSVGKIVRGYVVSIGKNFVLVGISRKIVGKIFLAHLSDAFVSEANLPKMFPIGKLLECRVAGIEASENHIALSSRESVVHPESFLSLENIKPDMKVKGEVVRSEKYGIFVQLNHSAIKALCHVSQIVCSKENATDEEKLAMLPIGSLVEGKILKVENKKVSIGEIDVATARIPKIIVDPFKGDVKQEQEQEQEPKQKQKRARDENEEEKEDEEEEEEEEEKRRKLNSDALPISDSFKWDEDNGMKEGNGEDEDEDEEKEEDVAMEEEVDEKKKKPTKEKREEKKEKKKITKKEKKEEKRRHEEEIAKKEAELANGKEPESKAEFERLIASSPKSSYLWIKFMAFHLSKSDIVSARKVVERAIVSIGSEATEERERFNVWVAFLNLENTYGTQETLAEVLERAITLSDNDKPILLQYARMLEESGKIPEAVEAFTRLLRKHKSSVKCWAKFAAFSLRTDPAHDTKKLLGKAMKGMPKIKQVRLVSALASSEFKHGSPERGRTMFEGALGLYPKRVDIWSVYLDMELRVGDVDIIRRLFERVTNASMKFSSKKMRSFFKRWLAFEKQFGTDDTISKVKQKAQEYIDSK